MFENQVCSTYLDNRQGSKYARSYLDGVFNAILLQHVADGDEFSILAFQRIITCDQSTDSNQYPNLGYRCCTHNA